jgi:deazaflavin-dependent oxidoreductase (nitroreductase family)
VAADDYCYLTTTGRRTGRPHEIEMWYAERGATLYLLAGARSADWVQNLRADPRAQVRLGAEHHQAVGRILDGPSDGAEARQARDLVFGKYQPRYEGALDDWRERSLPVALDLTDVQA